MSTASRASLARFRSLVVWLVAFAMILGCGAESNRRIAGAMSTSHTSSFSAWSEPANLGPAINSPFNEQQPAVSKDGLSLYFASNRPEGAADAVLDFNIWVSRRACTDDSCPWEAPVLLGPGVNTPFNDAGPAPSRDGHWLFLFSNRPGGFGQDDIWAAWRGDVHDDFAWGAPVNLGPGVNTADVEGGPGYFANDEVGVPQLYFNRSKVPQVAGRIYVSEQAADGSFGEAVEVLELNTDAPATVPAQRPSVAPNGLDLYFYSNRPGSSGNDIWVSTRESVLEPWGPPANVGPPINTAIGELLPFISSRGGTEWLYFTRNVASAPPPDLDLYVSTRTRAGDRVTARRP